MIRRHPQPQTGSEHVAGAAALIDPPPSVRSLRSYDAATGTSPFATADQLAELITADVAAAPAPSAGTGPWTIELTVYEVVAILRCLDELAAVYAGTPLDEVILRWSTELRRRTEATRASSSIRTEPR